MAAACYRLDAITATSPTAAKHKGDLLTEKIIQMLILSQL